MDLLLDTHTFLWYITGENQIPINILSIINNKDNYCYVSVASIWEIVIKMSLNKLDIKGGFHTIEVFLENNDFELLLINLKHTKALLSLPMLHNDPFDRIIISQAINDNLTIVTKDSKFREYEVKIVW